MFYADCTLQCPARVRISADDDDDDNDDEENDGGGDDDDDEYKYFKPCSTVTN